MNLDKKEFYWLNYHKNSFKFVSFKAFCDYLYCIVCDDYLAGQLIH